jgi:putative membrane protein
VGQGARFLDPVGWRFQAVALVENGALTRSGRWRRSTAFVPYARVQSVSARQGLLQRKLGIATVFLDLPKGSMRWAAKHRASEDAASLVAELGVQARRHRLEIGAGGRFALVPNEQPEDDSPESTRHRDDHGPHGDE